MTDTVATYRERVQSIPISRQIEIAYYQHNKTMVRRERSRLIRLGVIIPEHKMRPQMLVKNSDGSWSPEIRSVL